MLSNAIAIVNGKGGVGKTSTSANLAGIAAQAGWRVLAIDLDGQGNLARDLGYYDREGVDDEGRALATAIQYGDTLKVQPAIRDNLDVVPGGRHLKPVATAEPALGADAHLRLLDALRPIAGDYHLIVLDCPPGEGFLQRLAMHAVRFVVVPTQTDDAAIDGLSEVARLFAQVRRENRDLELLGVAIFDVPANAKRLIGEAVADVRAGLGDTAPVFDASIRSAKSLARELRKKGMLAHEYEGVAVNAPRPWEVGFDPSSRPVGSEGSASNLAGDYAALTKEILGRFRERVAAAATPA